MLTWVTALYNRRITILRMLLTDVFVIKIVAPIPLFCWNRDTSTWIFWVFLSLRPHSPKWVRTSHPGQAHISEGAVERLWGHHHGRCICPPPVQCSGVHRQAGQPYSVADLQRGRQDYVSIFFWVWSFSLCVWSPESLRKCACINCTVVYVCYHHKGKRSATLTCIFPG